MVHVDQFDVTQTVDLTLPARARLGDLLPSIVELADAAGGATRPGERWRLYRIGGGQLDESLTLHDNEIGDGELLWLTTEAVPGPVLVDCDTSRTVAAHSPPPDAVPRPVCLGLSLAAGGVGAGAIVWSANPAAVIAGAVWTIGSGAAAVAARRAFATDSSLCTAFGVLAAMLAAATGAVVVPAGPVAAHLLLASAAAFTVAVIMLRLNGVGTIPFTAVATASLLGAGASATAIAWHLNATAAGVVLATLALAGLSSAPRLAIALTRIGPPPPDPDAADPTILETHRAVLAHHTLTGMLVGTSSAVVGGAALVCTGTVRAGDPQAAAAAFNAVIGAALLLRTRTHVGAIRRSVLAVSGFAGLTTGFVTLMATAPQHAHWLGAVVVVAGAAALAPMLHLTPGLAARRAAEIGEYTALAAVPPLACWVADVFTIVRNLTLT